MKTEPTMNACKRVNRLGPARTVLNTAARKHGQQHRGRLGKNTDLVQGSGRASRRVTNAHRLTSRNQTVWKEPLTNPAPATDPFKTTAGLELIQRVSELLWLACERGSLTFEMVQDACAGEDLTPEDLRAIRLALGQAGVALVDAPAGDPVRFTPQMAFYESGPRQPQNVSVQPSAPQSGATPPLPRQAAPALLEIMEATDQDMRRILYSFGFTAHEHIARAEKLLVHPSAENFEHLVADSEIRSRAQYLKTLPKLVQQVRALDQKTTAAHRQWRQALGRPGGERLRAEFRKFDHRLRQTFPRFCYQAKVHQEMIALAQNFAARFQASRRVLQQAQRDRDYVWQMPRVDVERQSIENLEESVRLPCEVFLRSCALLETAGTRFRQARAELIRSHLHQVADLTSAYSNRGLSQPELMRAGIFGLIRAVDKFGHRRAWKFSTYAACWIQQSMREALAALPRTRRSPPLPTPPSARVA